MNHLYLLWIYYTLADILLLLKIFYYELIHKFISRSQWLLINAQI